MLSYADTSCHTLVAMQPLCWDKWEEGIEAFKKKYIHANM